MAYLRTDEELEVAHAMAMAANFAQGVESDPHLWRWIIIALHGATQGAAYSGEADHDSGKMPIGIPG